MPTALYSFDTSSFINGRRDLLPPEVFPAVWVDIEGAIASGMIRSIDIVKDELAKKDDDVKRWTAAQPGLFVQLDERTQAAASAVLAAHARLMGAGRGRNAADPFVIAFALARGGTVVTEETRSGTIANPRIPDVCEAMSVPWTNLVGFLRLAGWSYGPQG